MPMEYIVLSLCIAVAMTMDDEVSLKRMWISCCSSSKIALLWDFTSVSRRIDTKIGMITI